MVAVSAKPVATARRFKRERPLATSPQTQSAEAGEQQRQCGGQRNRSGIENARVAAVLGTRHGSANFKYPADAR
jgi:hypothetical protein